MGGSPQLWSQRCLFHFERRPAGGINRQIEQSIREIRESQAEKQKVREIRESLESLRENVQKEIGGSMAESAEKLEKAGKEAQGARAFLAIDIGRIIFLRIHLRRVRRRGRFGNQHGQDVPDLAGAPGFSILI